MKAYTDYPLTNNKPSQIVEIEVLSYDRNKYVTISHQGEVESIKSGYVYLDKALSRRPSKAWFWSRPRVAGDSAPTCKELHLDLKRDRRRKSAYEVWQGPTRREFSTLKAAAKYVRCKVKTLVGSDELFLSKMESGKDWWRHAPLMSASADGYVFIVDRKNHSVLKRAHLKILN